MKKPRIVAAVGLATTSDSARARAFKKIRDELIETGLAVDSDETTARIKAAYRRIRSEVSRDTRARGVREQLVDETLADMQKALRQATEGIESARKQSIEKRNAKTLRRHAKWQAEADAERKKPGRRRWKKWAIAREIAPRCRTTGGARPQVRTVGKVIK
jgi:hypothetical protein